jgi:hypothetical protein
MQKITQEIFYIKYIFLYFNSQGFSTFVYERVTPLASPAKCLRDVFYYVDFFSSKI